MLAIGVPNSTRLLFVAEMPICTCVSPRITILLIPDCEERRKRTKGARFFGHSRAFLKQKSSKGGRLYKLPGNSEAFDNNFMQSLMLMC
jgi:hypothetical protein